MTSLISRLAATLISRLAATIAIMVAIACAGAGAGAAHADTPHPPPDHMIFIKKSDRLATVFDYFGQHIDHTRSPPHRVVPLFFSALPPDFDTIADIRKRKQYFLQIMLPLVVQANNDISCTRKKLLELVEQYRQKPDGDTPPWGREDTIWIKDVLDRYTLANEKIDTTRIDHYLDMLLKRVQIVPTPLTLAQTIEESGWGTSRFARTGNAVFGQRTYHKKGKGLVPKALVKQDGHRVSDQAHFKVRIFPNLQRSVASYMHNLNTYPQYREFRNRRHSMAQNGHFDSSALAATMTRYSERGQDYVNTIRSIMNSNRLADFTDAALPTDLPEHLSSCPN